MRHALIDHHPEPGQSLPTSRTPARSSTSSPPATREKSDDPSVIREKVVALLRGYGEKRTEYIRQVAQASPGSVAGDLIAVIGSAKAIGGTHSAIERAWRAKGMTTTFISTDANGDSAHGSRTWPTIVLHVLHDQVDEPDPLQQRPLLTTL